jgi:hypothetical protein
VQKQALISAREDKFYRVKNYPTVRQKLGCAPKVAQRTPFMTQISHQR